MFSAFYADFCLCPKLVFITTLKQQLVIYDKNTYLQNGKRVFFLVEEVVLRDYRVLF